MTLHWLDRLLPRIARRSLRAKLIIVFALAIAVGSALIFVQTPDLVYRNALNETAQSARKVAAMTAYSAAPAVLRRDSAALQEVITAARQGGDVVYLVVTDESTAVMAAWKASLANRVGYSGFTGDPVAKKWNVYRVERAVIDENGVLIGRVHLGISLTRLQAETHAARRAAGTMAVILFLTRISFVFLIAHWLTRPLRAVVAATRRVSAGDLTARADTDTEDEVSLVAGSFNAVVERLTTAHAELQETHRTLEGRVEERTAELNSEVLERKRAETALVESERRFRSMFESSAIGVALFGIDGGVVEGNEALVRMLDTGATVDPSLTYGDLFAGESAPEANRLFADVAAGVRKSGQLKVMVRTGSGAIVWGYMVLSAVTDETGPRFVIAMIEDISEQKQLAEMYRQSQKLEAVGQLAGGVAHDFNNLLTTINGTVELMLDDAGSPSPFHADLQQVLDAGRRAATLTRQLLAFSRKQVLKPALLDVNVVVEEMGALMPRLAGEDVRFTIETQPGLPAIKADKTQLELVIINLVVNARDAMPDGGYITIETRRIHLNSQLATTYAASEGDYVEISVRDTGTGMDAVTLERVFEPFFTTKPTGVGTGLGLATVYGIVKQSGGGIRVESTPGRGSSFHIVLPAQSAAADVRPDEPKTSLERGAETVLVVEDEEAVRALFVRVLRRAGYHVLEARHGLDALVVAEDFPGVIHLVVSDVIMPGMNGPEAVRRLTMRRPLMKVLYVSGYTEDLVLEHARDITVNHLQKPVSPVTLCSVVRDLLDEETLVLPREDTLKLVG